MSTDSSPAGAARPPVPLAGDGIAVPCADGAERPYLSMDAAASTAALEQVVTRVREFIPWYSSVHRGAGYKSQLATCAYEDARSAALTFAGRPRGAADDDVAVICRNTTEAINHLAYRLRLTRDDVVVTTVAEHHANLLPWTRAATCRYVECGQDGTFGLSDVEAALDQRDHDRQAEADLAAVVGDQAPVGTVYLSGVELGDEADALVLEQAAELAVAYGLGERPSSGVT